MYARATTLQGSADAAAQSVEQYREALSAFREIPGNRGVFLFVDRASGKAIGVSLWESEQAMAESSERAEELRQQAAREAQGEVQSVDQYEVAVWDV